MCSEIEIVEQLSWWDFSFFLKDVREMVSTLALDPERLYERERTI